jgi:hypothetical protein
MGTDGVALTIITHAYTITFKYYFQHSRECASVELWMAIWLKGDSNLNSNPAIHYHYGIDNQGLSLRYTNYAGHTHAIWTA